MPGTASLKCGEWGRGSVCQLMQRMLGETFAEPAFQACFFLDPPLAESAFFPTRLFLTWRLPNPPFDEPAFAKPADC